MGTIKTTNIQSITGSGTVTIGQSGETIDIPSGVTFDSTGATVTGALTNTPAFSVIMSADQTGIGDNVETKVDFDTELYDTNSAFNTTDKKFTVPSGADGKYQFSACVTMAGTNCGVNNVKLYKNGSAIRWSRHNHIGGDAMDDVAINLVCTLDLSASDYIEIYAHLGTSGSNQRIKGQSSPAMTWFSGYRIGA